VTKLLLTIDTGAYASVARPDIAAGWPERQLKQRYTPQTISGKSVTVLKEVFLTANLGRHPLKILVLVATVTIQFDFGQDILCVYDASVDLGRKMLHLTEEEVSLWSPGRGPSLSAW
jgi:hypothetical protein